MSKNPNQKRIEEILEEMKELHPKKELAWRDLQDNLGNSSRTFVENLRSDFKTLKDRWNSLCDELDKLGYKRKE